MSKSALLSMAFFSYMQKSEKNHQLIDDFFTLCYEKKRSSTFFLIEMVFLKKYSIITIVSSFGGQNWKRVFACSCRIPIVL